MRENLKWRDDRHPDLWLYPSAGSIFKKIEDVGAGRLIDQCGLKGHIIGNAQFFHRHANIIVNLGGATAADVRALIALAQETVQRELGYEIHGNRDDRLLRAAVGTAALQLRDVQHVDSTSKISVAHGRNTAARGGFRP
jgi:hypothetical protein